MSEWILSSDGTRIFSPGETGESICRVYTGQNSIKYRRLIAAAPNLMAACWVAISDLQRLYTGQPDSDLQDNRAYKVLRAAIAKAEGK